MKRTLILVVAVLCVNTLFAQSPAKQSALKDKHTRILNSLLAQTRHGEVALKTTSLTTKERVVAQSTRDNTANTLNDSVKLGYSMSRTSTYDYNRMLFAYNYPYATSPMFNNSAGVYTKPQVFYDTFTHWQVDPNTLGYGYYETCYAGYDGNNNITSYKHLFADSAFYPNVICSNAYNSAKNIDTAFSYNYVLGVSQNAFRQFFTYNSSKLLIEDSTYEYHMGSWKISSKTYYTYNGSNDLIQIDNYANDTDTSYNLPLIEQIKYVNTYDASHRLLTVYSSFFDGTSLSPYIEDTFGYTGAYPFHTSWHEIQWDPINKYWAPMFNMTKVINSLGEPDTVTIQSFDSLLNSWVPQTLDVIHYNSFKDPDTLYDYEYNFTAFPVKPSFTTTYYYSTFLDRTEVKNVASPGDHVIIFPNPATNTINITGLDVPLSARVSFTLMNVSGQVVSRASLPWQNQAQVSMTGLVPGIYWVIIQDDAGNVLHKQAVVKQ